MRSGNRSASQHQLVRTGRIATAIMVVIALAWIPVIKNARGLYDLPAVGAGLSGAAHFRGVLLRRFLQASERRRVLFGP